MKPDLLDILQHSLGLDRYGIYNGARDGYRNHFASGPGCDHYALCRELVDAGFMVEHQPRASWQEYSTFVVTDRGREVVRAESPAPPKLSRSQRRYQRFLDADSSMSFGEWMKSEAKR